MTAEERYKLGLKSYCSSCEYCVSNNSYVTTEHVYKNTITKRKSKLKIKPFEQYCLHLELYDSKGKPYKINRNHLRWWGFSVNCPFNIFKHTCERCGNKMATEATICNSCKKNMQYQ